MSYPVINQNSDGCHYLINLSRLRTPDQAPEDGAARLSRRYPCGNSPLGRRQPIRQQRTHRHTDGLYRDWAERRDPDISWLRKVNDGESDRSSIQFRRILKPVFFFSLYINSLIYRAVGIPISTVVVAQPIQYITAVLKSAYFPCPFIDVSYIY